MDQRLRHAVKAVQRITEVPFRNEPLWGIRVEDTDGVLIQKKGACDIHDYINRGKFLLIPNSANTVSRVLLERPPHHGL